MLVQVNTRWFIQGGGKTGTFGLTYALPGDPTTGDLIAMAESQMEGVESNLALFSTTMQFGTCTAFGFQRAASGNPENPWYREKITPIVESTTLFALGTAASPPLPPQNAVVCTLRTNGVGRRALGRVFTPPPPEAVVSDIGIISDTGARQAWVRQQAENVESALTPASVEHIVYSLTYDEENQVEVYQVAGRIDTQRRRLQRLPR